MTLQLLGAYDKIDINTSKDPQKCSKLSKQLQRSTHMTNAIRKYDDVETDWTNKMMPGDYEPVYHEPNYIHVDKPTGECVLFDDATYGVKPRDYEVVCQNPNVTQEKRPTSEYVYFNDGMYVNDDIEMSPTENENHPHTLSMR